MDKKVEDHLDFTRELEFRKNKEMQRRKLIASLLEAFIYLAISTSIFSYYFLVADKSKISPPDDIKFIVGLLFSGAFIVSLFSMILASVSPLVAVFANAGTHRSASPPKATTNVVINGTPIFDRSGALPEIGEMLSNDHSVAELIKEHIDRSQALLKTAQGRPNALLFGGFVIAIAGLIFFIATLPNTYSEPPSDIKNVPTYLWTVALQVLPRLLMLIFIQVLAGFFLRQYRSAMEDYRYFETVLRHRESEHLSYLIRVNSKDKKSILRFAEDILKAGEVGVLNKGQTTAALESLKTEVNDLGDTANRLVSVVEKLRPAKTPQVRSGKPATGR